jgi:ribonuclease HII
LYVPSRRDPLYASPEVTFMHRIGVDENGLGARLGPLVVTAVLARVDAAGERALGRALPRRIRADLDDSKKLVSHGDFALGEAWARVLVGADVQSPNDLLDRLCLESDDVRRAPCPSSAVARQCWSAEGEEFIAPDNVVSRLGTHVAALAKRGIHLTAVRSSVICNDRINEAKRRGHNRFVVDLHAMERLVIAFRKSAGADVVATCGKVGGMGEYGKFFGPLAGWLHVVLEERRAHSAYRFPGLGELHFVQDADASHPLVMLASLVGKYIRELTMARIARYYSVNDGPSGYHDPVTTEFIATTALVRAARNVPRECFERIGDENVNVEPVQRKHRKGSAQPTRRGTPADDG